MLSELQAILAPDLVPMLVVNALALILGVCFMIVALTSKAELSRPVPRVSARV